ncbi:MAG: 50S ribosomal protein L34e [Candidatus Woesearchaeota archaeon]|nr:50S ribosomal protein L34e [Candidatus Woesearchaeota archaeon]
MPSGKYRSRRYRRVFRRTPSGKTKLHYRKRKPAQPKCALCGSVLKGMPRARALRLRKIAKTKKRPERPYGGNLCSKCMRAKIIEKARSEDNV